MVLYVSWRMWPLKRVISPHTSALSRTVVCLKPMLTCLPHKRSDLPARPQPSCKPRQHQRYSHLDVPWTFVTNSNTPLPWLLPFHRCCLLHMECSSNPFVHDGPAWLEQLGSGHATQEGDPYPQYPDDADVPEGQSEVAFRVKAATDIKALGNDLYKKVLPITCCVYNCILQTFCTLCCNCSKLARLHSASRHAFIRTCQFQALACHMPDVILNANASSSPQGIKQALLCHSSVHCPAVSKFPTTDIDTVPNVHADRVKALL